MSEPRLDRWQLPDGVDELLPADAWRLEALRRDVVDCCRSWGFELVMPPLIEYIDSLLTGSGETMNVQTFKLIDQNNGRTLGVRADITPQVARMDAHALRSPYPNRLCFAGTTLRTRADSAGGSRTPQQFGAELFGHAGAESDIEVIRLMLECATVGGIEPSRQLLDLGHVGVYRTLVDDARLDARQEGLLFEAMRRGSVPDVMVFLDTISLSQEQRARLIALCTLRGEAGVAASRAASGAESIVSRARRELDGAGEGVDDALATLESIVAALARTHPDVRVLIDLAELRGYRYHTGTLFAVHDDAGAELAHGGRYDSIGEAFGHARPATGFSGELVQLLDRAQTLARAASTRVGVFPSSRSDASGDIGMGVVDRESAIHVGAPEADGAWPEIRRLRNLGERVICALSDDGAERRRCDRELVFHKDGWRVQPLV